jgi:hypothetical protein
VGYVVDRAARCSTIGPVQYEERRSCRERRASTPSGRVCRRR